MRSLDAGHWDELDAVACREWRATWEDLVGGEVPLDGENEFLVGYEDRAEVQIATDSWADAGDWR